MEFDKVHVRDVREPGNRTMCGKAVPTPMLDGAEFPLMEQCEECVAQCEAMANEVLQRFVGLPTSKGTERALAAELSLAMHTPAASLPEARRNRANGSMNECLATITAARELFTHDEREQLAEAFRGALGLEQ